MNTDIATNKGVIYLTKKQIVDLVILALTAAIMIAKAVSDTDCLPEINETNDD